MLRELQTFLAIARYGTFSAAGERIGLTQSAVSAQIKRLEDDLQVALFERNARSAKLSEAGRSLLTMGQQMLASYEEMRERVRGNLPCGTLRIGAIASAQIGLLPDALVDFRAQYPRIDVKINPGNSAQLLDQLDADELDMVVVIRPPFSLPKQWHWQPLLSEPYVLIAPLDVHANTPAQILENHPFIRYERLSFGGRLVQRYLAERRIAVNDAMELKELEAIVRMVERGLGVSIIPRTGVLSLQNRNVRVITLGISTFYREIGVIEPDVRSRRPSTAALVSCLQKASRASSSRKRPR